MKQKIKDQQLAFYQTVLAEQLKMGSGMTNILITLSVSLIALLPHIYKNGQRELLNVILVGYGLVVLLGLLMHRIDYRQLQELQKRNNGEKSKDFSKITYPLLVCMLTTFFLTSSVMIYVGTHLISDKENITMPVQKIIINCEERKDYSGITVPTGGGGKKPKKDIQK